MIKGLEAYWSQSTDWLESCHDGHCVTWLDRLLYFLVWQIMSTCTGMSVGYVTSRLRLLLPFLAEEQWLASIAIMMSRADTCSAENGQALSLINSHS